MTGKDLLAMGIIDEVIPEPLGGAHRDHREAGANLKSYLLRALREIQDAPAPKLARPPLPEVPQDRHRFRR